MWALLTVACLNSTVPTPGVGATPASEPVSAATPTAAPAPGDPRGAWYVVWDRSSTGWSPRTFNGVMVLGADSVALDFQESSAEHTLDSVKIDGSTFEVVARIPKRTPPADATEQVKAASAVDTMVSIRGFVEGDRLLGYMQVMGVPGNQVPWTPFTGKRAMLAAPPSAMPKTVGP